MYQHTESNFRLDSVLALVGQVVVVVRART